MTAEKKKHGNPAPVQRTDVDVNPVCTNQVKLSKNPSPEEVEWMRKSHKAREVLAKYPIAKDKDGKPVYAGKNVAVQYFVNCLADALEHGDVKVETARKWLRLPKAKKAEPKKDAKKGLKKAEKALNKKLKKASKPAKKAKKTKK